MKRILLAALLALFATSAEAATCTWNGTAGDWTNSNTASWSCGHVPITSDTVVFDGTSGTAVVSVCGSSTSTCPNATSGAAMVNTSSITMNTYNGTLDFSVVNPNVTLVSGGTAISANGAGSPIIKLGSGTFTVAPGSIDFTSANASSTFNASTFVINAAPPGNPTTFLGAGKAYGTMIVNSRTNGVEVSYSGNNSFTSLIINGPVRTQFALSSVTTVSGTFTVNGTSTGLASLANASSNSTSQATLALAGATVSVAWAAFKQINVTGTPLTSGNSTSTFDLGANTNVTGVPPTGGGGAALGHIIGG